MGRVTRSDDTKAARAYTSDDILFQNCNFNKLKKKLTYITINFHCILLTHYYFIALCAYLLTTPRISASILKESSNEEQINLPPSGKHQQPFA